MRKSGLGLSLLEVVFASFLFAGLVTILSVIWVLHARAQQQTGLLLVAADLADLEMTRALSQGYHGVSDSTGSYTQTWEVRGQQINHVFATQVEVSALEENGVPVNMKLVRVTIRYGSATSPSEQKTHTLEGMLTDDN